MAVPKARTATGSPTLLTWAFTSSGTLCPFGRDRAGAAPPTEPDLRRRSPDRAGTPAALVPCGADRHRIGRMRR
ncbi:hypothetical protein ACWGIU_35200, partial [Streptomyces sp. NPDC054840]